MCRLWGVMYGPDGPSSEPITPSEIAQILFPALVHRGPDAYGWMSLDKEEQEVSITKHIGACDTNEALTNMVDIDEDCSWIVGHARLATHGTPEEMANNHPIQHKDFIGVHNGVIRNYKQILDETGREDPVSRVDSEAIFAAIARWGHKGGLRRLSGGLVAIYTSLQYPNRIYLAKSHTYTLSMGRTLSGNLFFASEAQALHRLGLEWEWLSELSRYRLLRIEKGEITKRLTWDPYSDSSNTIYQDHAISQFSIRNITDHFDKQRPFRMDPSYEIPIAVGNQYCYRGRLLDEEEMLSEMEAEMQASEELEGEANV